MALTEREAVGGAEDCGYYVRSRCFAFGVTTHGLVVTVAWGAFDEAEARALAAHWRATFAGPRRDTLLDVTHLAMTDPGAFVAVRDRLAGHRDERARVVRRQAIVSRDEYGAVFVRGYFATFPPPYALRRFVDGDAALAWLDHACCRDDLRELAAHRDDLLARLRRWLDDTELEGATLARAVRELGVTQRTLQRRLAAAGTRFSAELARAQVVRAQQLMRDPRRTLAAIARDVGCASPSTFSELFRRVAGESPRQWRRRSG